MESQLAGSVTLESSVVTHREPLVAPESSAASPLLSLYFHMPPSTIGRLPYAAFLDFVGIGWHPEFRIRRLVGAEAVAVLPLLLGNILQWHEERLRHQLPREIPSFGRIYPAFKPGFVIQHVIRPHRIADYLPRIPRWPLFLAFALRGLSVGFEPIRPPLQDRLPSPVERFRRWQTVLRCRRHGA